MTINEIFKANCNVLKSSNPNLAEIICNLKNTDNSCYAAPALSKTNDLVPALKDGKALFSIYNPGTLFPVPIHRISKRFDGWELC